MMMQFDDGSMRTGNNMTHLPLALGPTIQPIPMPTNENRVERRSFNDDDSSSPKVTTSEDDDLDKIYVTNQTNKPFKIKDLDNYDPEEDFQMASNDLEGPKDNERSSSKSSSSRSSSSSNQDPDQDSTGLTQEPSKDVVFSDPEADALFNDASETDEVTFAADEPDWNDAPESQEEAEVANDEGRREPERRESTRSNNRRILIDTRRSDDDTDDGSWVNDGVDDMEIPSSQEQERAIQKAAKEEEALERQRLAEAPSEEQPQAESGDDASDQRMPNADYLKDDLKELEDETALR